MGVFPFSTDHRDQVPLPAHLAFRSGSTCRGCKCNIGSSKKNGFGAGALRTVGCRCCFGMKSPFSWWSFSSW